MCGTLLEASEMRWLSSFPRLRSLHTNATPSAASLALIPRKCPPPLRIIRLPLLVNSWITNNVTSVKCCSSKTEDGKVNKSLLPALILLLMIVTLFMCVCLSSSPVCWPPAQQTRPVRSGGRPISRWWRSWASRATILERHQEAGCGTVLSLETPSILSPVSTWANMANGLSLQWNVNIQGSHAQRSAAVFKSDFYFVLEMWWLAYKLFIILQIYEQAVAVCNCRV